MEKTNRGEQRAAARLSEYNRIIKENDDLYRGIAKALGMSDCAFWILYVLRESEEPVPQSEIRDALYEPKQTVNSALKKMEAEGYIRMEEMEDRRSRRIRLTQKGETLAQGTVDRVFAIEHKALAGMTEEEQENFLGLFHKYTDLLRIRMNEGLCVKT